MSSLREWGRVGDTDDNSQYKDIPSDYPGRYIFKHKGMNLKPLELQCALGRTQLQKLDDIKELRQRNFDVLFRNLQGIKGISLPFVHELSQPSWFSFSIMAERRGELRDFLEARNIETRTIFGGNITKQPAFSDFGRAVGSLENSDAVMKNGMFVSVHPSSTPEMMEYVANSIREFYSK
jgi:CDP-6-deoxy-D-xylo-4-hexulose-3-dehydrase